MAKPPPPKTRQGAPRATVAKPPATAKKPAPGSGPGRPATGPAPKKQLTNAEIADRARMKGAVQPRYTVFEDGSVEWHRTPEERAQGRSSRRTLDPIQTGDLGAGRHPNLNAAGAGAGTYGGLDLTERSRMHPYPQYLHGPGAPSLHPNRVPKRKFNAGGNMASARKLKSEIKREMRQQS